MNPDLKDYSDDDLLAELGSRKNKDWYFIVEEKDDPDEKFDFLIVHKKMWHEEHRVSDSHINHLLKLPDSFCEVMESTFEYEGTTEQGDNLLKQYGLTKIENPFWDSLFVYCPKNGTGWPRLNITCDTAEIKNLTKEWIYCNLPARSDKINTNWNKENYLTKVGEFTKKHNLTHILQSDFKERNGVWQGATISLLDENIAKNLPDYPKEYYE